PFALAVPFGTWRRNLLHPFIRILISSGNLAEITEAQGHRRFGSGAFPAEKTGKSNKNIGHGRVVRATEQRRNIKPGACCRFPSHGWTDDETVHGIAACVFGGDVLIFHFYANLQPFVRQKNRYHRSLREAPLASAVPSILLFEEPVHRPFEAIEELLSKEQTNFVGIGNLGRAALFFFFSSPRRRRNFFVSNGADTELVFSEECRIERDLIPISQGPSCFQAHRLRAATSIESFEL